MNKSADNLYTSVEHCLLATATRFERLHPNAKHSSGELYPGSDKPGKSLERKGSRRFDKQKKSVVITFTDGSAYRISATKIR